MRNVGTNVKTAEGASGFSLHVGADVSEGFPVAEAQSKTKTNIFARLKVLVPVPRRQVRGRSTYAVPSSWATRSLAVSSVTANGCSVSSSAREM